eukprot:5877799-Amphidinium_carterae.1
MADQPVRTYKKRLTVEQSSRLTLPPINTNYVSLLHATAVPSNAYSQRLNPTHIGEQGANTHQSAPPK